jgi:DNA-binding Lrp family transcriptional regulator
MTTTTITVCTECYDETTRSHARVREACYRDGTVASRLSDTLEQGGHYTDGPEHNLILDDLVLCEVYDHGAAGASLSELADRLGIHRDPVTASVDRLVNAGGLVTSAGARGAKLVWTSAYGAGVHLRAIFLDAEDKRLAGQRRDDFIRRYKRGERKINDRTHAENVEACLDYLRSGAAAKAA